MPPGVHPVINANFCLCCSAIAIVLGLFVSLLTTDTSVSISLSRNSRGMWPKLLPHSISTTTCL